MPCSDGQQDHGWSGTGRRRRPSCGPLLFPNEWHADTAAGCCCWGQGAGARGGHGDIQLTWCKLSHSLASANALRSGVNIHVYDCYIAFSHIQTYSQQLFGPHSLICTYHTNQAVGSRIIAVCLKDGCRRLPFVKVRKLMTGLKVSVGD